MSKPIDPKTNTMRIKLRQNGRWVWQEIRLRPADVRWIEQNMKQFKDASPILEKRYHKYEIRIAFKINQKLYPEKELLEHPICAVDLGINTDATCSIMTCDGTVIARKFLDFALEKDRLYTLLHRISKKQRNHGPWTVKGLWAYARRLNKDLADRIASAIVEFASLFDCSVIVFEHLDFQGKRKHGSKAQRLSNWRHGDIQERAEYKAHWNGIRIRRINPWGTSKYAFDGSGEIKRNSKNQSLCTFQNGKQYNADLSASYNIGARFFIRELTKTWTATERSLVQAKVPGLGRRITWTLSTLRDLWRELNILEAEIQKAS